MHLPAEYREPMIRSRYPHMLEHDNRIWSRFLMMEKNNIDKVWYDVYCGTPITNLRTGDKASQNLAEGTGCKRIDVVMIWNNSLTIVEIKPFGNHAGIGQLMIYEDQFRIRYTNEPRPDLLLLCEIADVDAQFTCDRLNVRLRELGP